MIDTSDEVAALLARADPRTAIVVYDERYEVELKGALLGAAASLVTGGSSDRVPERLVPELILLDEGWQRLGSAILREPPGLGSLLQAARSRGWVVEVRYRSTRVEVYDPRFPWMTRPPARSLTEAVAALRALGCTVEVSGPAVRIRDRASRGGFWMSVLVVSMVLLFCWFFVPIFLWDYLHGRRGVLREFFGPHFVRRVVTNELELTPDQLRYQRIDEAPGGDRDDVRLAWRDLVALCRRDAVEAEGQATPAALRLVSSTQVRLVSWSLRGNVEREAEVLGALHDVVWHAAQAAQQPPDS